MLDGVLSPFPRSLVAPVVQPGEYAADFFAVENMDAPRRVDGLALLVEDAAVLRDGEGVDPRAGGGDCGTDGRAGIVVPCAPEVGAVGVPEIVVCYDVGGFAPGPGDVERGVGVVYAVDVGVVVVPLDVFADGGPGARGVLVQVAIARAGSNSDC